MSLSLKIFPIWTSIILTGDLKGFSILCIDPWGINAVSFAAPNTTQTATNTVSIFGNPAVPGLAVDTTYQFVISTVNNAFLPVVVPIEVIIGNLFTFSPLLTILIE